MAKTAMTVKCVRSFAAQLPGGGRFRMSEGEAADLSSLPLEAAEDWLRAGFVVPELPAPEREVTKGRERRRAPAADEEE